MASREEAVYHRCDVSSDQTLSVDCTVWRSYNISSIYHVSLMLNKKKHKHTNTASVKYIPLNYKPWLNRGIEVSMSNGKHH